MLAREQHQLACRLTCMGPGIVDCIISLSHGATQTLTFLLLLLQQGLPPLHIIVQLAQLLVIRDRRLRLDEFQGVVDWFRGKLPVMSCAMGDMGLWCRCV